METKEKTNTFWFSSSLNSFLFVVFICHWLRLSFHFLVFFFWVNWTKDKNATSEYHRYIIIICYVWHFGFWCAISYACQWFCLVLIFLFYSFQNSIIIFIFDYFFLRVDQKVKHVFHMNIDTHFMNTNGHQFFFSFLYWFGIISLTHSFIQYFSKMNHSILTYSV